jgi:hypothetical protein
MTKLTNILLGAILVIGLGILIVSLRPEVQPNINVVPSDVNVSPVFGSENEFYSGVTATVVSVSASKLATSTNLVLAANSGRQYAILQNTGNVRISCLLTSTTTDLVIGTGINLTSSTTNTTYEITPDNLYKGAIYCISETSTGTISVVEK